MVRSACCVKASIKKGPWTPEEDIVLVSYIQEHGPGNWRLVPTSTGLMRCSKSCRLRWTNYLRPGIKRGNFTPHEEGIIVQLQALLGNRWAAIASYLPQRTDNDIKNYWNTHLKKKLKKYEFARNINTQSDSGASSSHEIIPSISSNPPAVAHIPSTYASSAENISRLLEGWMRSSPNHPLIPSHHQNLILEHQMKKETNAFTENQLVINADFNLQMIAGESVNEWGKIEEKFGFEEEENNKEFTMMEFDQKMRLESQNLLEKWLFEENAGRGSDALLEISGAGCCSEDMF